MARFFTLFLFVAISAENYSEFPFHGKWETIFKPIGELIYRPSPLKAPLVALVVLLVLVLSRSARGARTGRIRALDQALYLHLASTALMLGWGIMRGGNMQAAILQVQTMVFLPIVGFTCVSVFRSEQDFREVGKWIVYAAIYRGTLVIYFYFFIVPGLEEVPATMTTHADTILFSSAIVGLLSWALEDRQKKNIWRAALGCAYLLLAVQLNNRRLAYVSLGGAVLVLYILLEKDDFKKRLNRKLLMMVPVIAVYIAVGWNSNSKIFKPVQAIASMAGPKQDASSQTRDIENYNLIITLSEHMIMGSGWGHEYREVSVAYSVAETFPLYRYIPHNSVLGLWGFVGWIGSSMLWTPLVVAAYLCVRGYKYSSTPIGRTICATALCEISIYGLQAYGDMGLYAWNGNLAMGVAFGAASRMAALHGALPESTSLR